MKKWVFSWYFSVFSQFTALDKNASSELLLAERAPEIALFRDNFPRGLLVEYYERATEKLIFVHALKKMRNAWAAQGMESL